MVASSGLNADNQAAFSGSSASGSNSLFAGAPASLLNAPSSNPNDMRIEYYKRKLSSISGPFEINADQLWTHDHSSSNHSLGGSYSGFSSQSWMRGG